jgi:hypothetical protein
MDTGKLVMVNLTHTWARGCSSNEATRPANDWNRGSHNSETAACEAHPIECHAGVATRAKRRAGKVDRSSEAFRGSVAVMIVERDHPRCPPSYAAAQSRLE